MTSSDQIKPHTLVHGPIIIRAAIGHPMNGVEVINPSKDRRGQNFQRVVFLVAVGIVATSCYGGIAVEPRHASRNEERHENRREEQREQPRREHRDTHGDDEHHDNERHD